MNSTKQRAQIALLLTIRQMHQPISFNQMMELAQNGDERIPVEARHDLLACRNISVSYEWINELLETGLVRTRDGHASANARLEAVPELLKIQDLFSISLRDMLERHGDEIKVRPIFGQPAAHIGREAWATVFVAMPFREELKPIFEDHILAVTKRLGISCKRGDDFFTAGNIHQEVYSAIYHARVIIADCTGKNANVFYELGMAHALGRKAILIGQSRDDFPFDVSHIRCYEYKYTPPGMRKFERELKQTLCTELGL